MPDPASVLVGLVLLAAFAFAAAGGLRRRKRGGDCPSGCKDCPAREGCRPESRKEKG